MFTFRVGSQILLLERSEDSEFRDFSRLGDKPLNRIGVMRQEHTPELDSLAIMCRLILVE